MQQGWTGKKFDQDIRQRQYVCDHFARRSLNAAIFALRGRAVGPIEYFSCVIALLFPFPGRETDVAKEKVDVEAAVAKCKPV